MKIRAIVAQSKSLKIKRFETFLVPLILNSLRSQYGPFKISYNTHKEKWSISELLTICGQQEDRLIQEMGESAHMVTYDKDKKQANQKKEKAKAPAHTNKKASKCFLK